MTKAFVCGSLTDIDALSKQLSDLDEANRVERGKAPSPFTPEGNAEIFARYNKTGKYAEKKKPVRK